MTPSIDHNHPECIRMRKLLDAERARGCIGIHVSRTDEPLIDPYTAIAEFNDMMEAPDEPVDLSSLD